MSRSLRIILEALPNIIAIVGGTVLLGMQFGWKVGVGVGLLVWFHKGPE